MITYQQHSEKCTFLFSTFWAFLYWHLQLTRFSNTMRYNRQLWKALHLYLLTRFSNRLVGAVAVRCALQNTWILIYIPLCIYFNPALVALISSIGLDLHSTMYLFQRRLHRLSALRLCLFTFHYVSISTKQNYTMLDNLKLFTFHYVSISTRYLRSLLSCLFYLHSTMYLFQRSSASVWKS